MQVHYNSWYDFYSYQVPTCLQERAVRGQDEGFNGGFKETASLFLCWAIGGNGIRKSQDPNPNKTLITSLRPDKLSEGQGGVAQIVRRLERSEA